MYVVFLVACFCYGPLQIPVLDCKLADLSIIRKFDVTMSVLVVLLQWLKMALPKIVTPCLVCYALGDLRANCGTITDGNRKQSSPYAVLAVSCTSKWWSI